MENSHKHTLITSNIRSEEVVIVSTELCRHDAKTIYSSLTIWSQEHELIEGIVFRAYIDTDEVKENILRMLANLSAAVDEFRQEVIKTEIPKT